MIEYYGVMFVNNMRKWEMFKYVRWINSIEILGISPHSKIHFKKAYQMHVVLGWQYYNFYNSWHKRHLLSYNRD